MSRNFSIKFVPLLNGVKVWLDFLFLSPHGCCCSRAASRWTLLLVNMCWWRHHHRHHFTWKRSWRGMWNQPRVDDISRRFSHEIILRKVLMFIEPSFHSRQFRIIMVVLMMIGIYLKWQCHARWAIVIMTQTSSPFSWHSALRLLNTSQMKSWKEWH